MKRTILTITLLGSLCLTAYADALPLTNTLLLKSHFGVADPASQLGSTAFTVGATVDQCNIIDPSQEGSRPGCCINFNKPNKKRTVTKVTGEQATIVPLQLLRTATNTTTVRNECTEGESEKLVQEGRSFSVNGNIQRNTDDTQHECEKSGSCFHSCGNQYDDYFDVNGQKINGCEEVREPSLFKKAKQTDPTDPEADVEKKIVSQVQKTISDILSDVINRCISSSLADVIDIEDETS